MKSRTLQQLYYVDRCEHCKSVTTISRRNDRNPFYPALVAVLGSVILMLAVELVRLA